MFLSIKSRLLMISALVTFSPDSKYSDGIIGCPSDNCLCCLVVVAELADAGTSAFSTDTGAFSTDTGELSTDTGASALLDDAELPGFDDDDANCLELLNCLTMTMQNCLELLNL